MSIIGIICAPNYIDSEYAPPVFTQGAWSLPLSNLATEDLTVEVARSTGITTTQTKFDVYFGGELRDVTASVLPWTNCSNTGQYRVQYSVTPAWEDVTAGAASAGATSLTFTAGASDVLYDTTHHFRIAGDTTVYRITATGGISAGGSFSIPISPALAADVTAGTPLECVTGDFTTPEYDSGWKDAIPTIYPPLYPYWGHPSFWDGKPSAEDRLVDRYPIIEVHEAVKFAMFQRWEFDDTANADGYIEIPRLFVVPGWQPPYNCVFGSFQGFQSSTTSKETLASKDIYDVRETRRTFNLSFPDLDAEEVYSNIFDVLRRGGKHKQLFVIFNPEDTYHLHRRSFIATVEELPQISYDYFGGPDSEAYQAVSLTFAFREVVA